MNLNVNNLKISLAGLVAGVALSSQAFAQVSTPIVGFQKSTIPVGRSVFSAPLILEEIGKATVSNNTSSQLDTNLAPLSLSSSSQYYIEVITGAYEGDRIDIDVAATNAAQSSTPGRIVLKAASHNTNTLLGSELVGAQIAVRKHLTFSAIAGLVSSGSLVANASASSADQILLFENNAFQTYYYFGVSQGWYRQSPFGSAQAKVIPPGSALMFIKRSSPLEITSLGGVRTTKLQMPLVAGNQFISTGFPVDSQLSSLSSTGTWTANATAANADQVLVFNGSSFDTYYYFSASQGWYRQSPFTRSTSNVINGASGIMLRRKNANLDYAITSPVNVN